MKIKIPTVERVQYVMLCILTFGTLFMMKLVIKRAMIEFENLKNGS
jgi:hypothetical protein